MKKLTKQDLQKIIREEVSLRKENLIWEHEVKPALRITRDRLIEKGHDPERIDENILSGLLSNILKLGGAQTADMAGLESLDLAGGVSSGVRVAIEQTIIEKIVEAFGLDPYFGLGNIFKNAIEVAFKEITVEEIKDLFASNSQTCQPVGTKLASITLITIEESGKEQLLTLIMNSIIGTEAATTMRTAPFAKQFYQNMREAFSDGLGRVLSNPDFHAELGAMICDNLNLENLLGDKASEIKNDIMGAFSSQYDAFQDLIPEGDTGE